jgi:formate-dependent phosphoribosylglycinamide formyltransferase (GAR transformylase)
VKKVLFLATTTGYQTRMFGAVAERLGVQLVFATDRCEHLEDPWADSAIAIRFHQETESVEAIVRALSDDPPHGLLVVGDRAATIAALTARIMGLPGHPPEAAAAARDKHLTRERLRAAGLAVPWFMTLPDDAAPDEHAAGIPFPAVVKPLMLSGSRGVIRANTPGEFVDAFRRVQRLLRSPDVRVMKDRAANKIQVESFIEGREYAVEGVLHHGELYTLALFDKPDLLDGPFFEETIYVTPSRAGEAVEREIQAAVVAATRALGLHHGPIHAECRVNTRGVFVLEVAARPIGGLCAKALAFDGPHQQRIGLEELLVRHALGESPARWTREAGASGVMMIPIPRAGVYRRVDGVGDARQVRGVTDVQITAKPDQQLVPLPEGASYLGFVFAKGESPEAVEHALRVAHARLAFVIDRPLPLTGTDRR